MVVSGGRGGSQYNQGHQQLEQSAGSHRYDFMSILQPVLVTPAAPRPLSFSNQANTFERPERSLLRANVQRTLLHPSQACSIEHPVLRICAFPIQPNQH